MDDLPDENSEYSDAGSSNDDDLLILEQFFPYQITMLTKAVSMTLAKTYVDDFGITIPEWRVMAALGRFPGCTASHVGRHSGLDKVQISRAVAELMSKDYVSREKDPQDRRNAFLTMTDKGMEIYRAIVPVARDYEEKLLGSLPAKQRREFQQLLTNLTRRAQDL